MAAVVSRWDLAVSAATGIYDAFAAFDLNADGMMDLVIGGAPVVAKNTVVACPAITVGPATLPDATKGLPYSVTLTQTGGAGSTTYKLSGAPTGLSFFGGTLSGTPTQLGTFAITVKAYDGNGCPGSASYELHVRLETPTNIAATADEVGLVHVTWNGVSGSDYY